MSGRLAASVLAAATVAWVALIVLTPLALAHGYVTLPTVVYEACSLICHQRPERSFHLLGIQLPVCARCFGLYASGAVGAVAASLAAARVSLTEPTADPRAWLLVAAVPTAVTLGCEWSGLWYPTGASRAVAAIPLGLTAGWVVIRGLLPGPTPARPPAQVRYHS